MYNNIETLIKHQGWARGSKIHYLIQKHIVEGKSKDEITLWKSVGTSIQDAAIAKLAYDKALDKGLGLDIKTD